MNQGGTETSVVVQSGYDIFNGYNFVCDKARRFAGLGDKSIPFVEEIGSMTGSITGRQSPDGLTDGLRGYRLDSNKGFHINW